MRRLWKTLAPRCGDLALLLIVVYACLVASLPTSYLVDWNLPGATPFRSVEGYSGVLLVGLAGLANAFAACLVFSRWTMGRRLLSAFGFFALTIGAYEFGINNASFDPWQCERTSAIRYVPLFWLWSLLIFALVQLVNWSARRYQRQIKNFFDSKGRSPIVWVGVPIAIVLWLVHVTAQLQTTSSEGRSFDLFMIFPTLLLLALAALPVIVPAIMCIWIASPFRRSFALTAYFLGLCVACFLIPKAGLLELLVSYAATFLSGIFVSRWYYEARFIWQETNDPILKAGGHRLKGFSLPAKILCGATLVAAAYFLTQYDLFSLVFAKGGRRFQVARLNRVWGKSLDRRNHYFELSCFDPSTGYLKVGPTFPQRDWKVVSRVAADYMWFEALTSSQVPSDLSFMPGVTGMDVIRCNFDDACWQRICKLPGLSKLSCVGMTISVENARAICQIRNLSWLNFRDCNVEPGAVEVLGGSNLLRFLGLENCGELWSDLAKFQRQGPELRLRYTQNDVVPSERVFLERNANVRMVYSDPSNVQRAFETRDSVGNLDWTTVAQKVERDPDGQITRLEIPGITLPNAGIGEIVRLSKLQWLGLSADNRRWYAIRQANHADDKDAFEEFDYAPLEKLGNLRHVRIEAAEQFSPYNPRETIADQKSLASTLSRLESLQTLEIELSPTSTPADQVNSLARIAQLKKITIKCYELEASDIQPLLHLPELRELVICSPMKGLDIDEGLSKLRQLAPNVNIRREVVERYEWPKGGDEVPDEK